METLIQKVLNNLEGEDLNNFKFIMPSRRSIVFLKREISKQLDSDCFFPEIITIEDLMKDISGLEKIDNINLFFEFYKSYKNVEQENAEKFEEVIKWSNIFLRDSNEINLHSENPQDIIDYLVDVDRIENWNPENSPSSLVDNYIGYWKKFNLYFKEINKNLLEKGLGYQGLIFRTAIENLENFNFDKKLIFIGFNALTHCEIFMIRKILKEGKGKIFWDTDEHYLNDIDHEAGLFLRRYKKWNYYNSNEFLFKENYLKEQKNIYIYGTSGNTNQALCVNNILNSKIESKDETKTAVALADETLLIPVLNTLPKDIKDVNITMEYPIKNTPIAQFFRDVINMYINRKKLGLKDGFFYYRDIIGILRNSFLQRIIKTNTVVDKIKIINDTIVSKSNLENIFLEVDNNFLGKEIFENTDNSAISLLEKIIIFLSEINKYKNEKFTDIEREYLYHISKIFFKIKNILKSNNLEFDIDFLNRLYNEILNQETIPFVGEPLSGVQIMGMLETRLLDFENIIITSINEGILPEGKGDNSYIPYNVKKKFNIPTYDDKDAIFSYHFYRLLQRSKNIHLVYNSQTDSFGTGEESRFIKQILFELKDYHNIKIEYPFSSNVSKKRKKEIVIEKTDEIIEKIKLKLENGISASAINLYLKSPLEFYERYILGIREEEEKEESISPQTMGNILHKTVENLYHPFINKNLTKQDLLEFKKNYPPLLKKNILEIYKGGRYDKGKNLLILEGMNYYLNSFFDNEIKSIEDKNLLIKGIEEENIFKIININNIKVKLSGKIDRIDELGNDLRVIDYKSSLGDSDLSKNRGIMIEHIDIELLKDKPKVQQLLFYSSLLETKYSNFKNGIYSFKNGQYKFLEIEKSDIISNEIIDKFEETLTEIITEILDKNIPFTEE